MKLTLKALHTRRTAKRRGYYHAYCSPDIPHGIKPRLGTDCGCKSVGRGSIIRAANLFL